MRCKKRSRPILQADLFQPSSPEPMWHELPSDVRDSAILLIAQLLREHRRPKHRRLRPMEPCDE
jgi:hypothetical protein